jgi:hypothetical protein
MQAVQALEADRAKLAEQQESVRQVGQRRGSRLIVRWSDTRACVFSCDFVS